MAMPVDSAIGKIFPSNIPEDELTLFLTGMVVFVVSTIVAIVFDFLWFLAVPFSIVLLFVLFHNIKAILYLIVILVPFSVELQIPGFGSALQFPTEPLIILMLIFWIIQLVYSSHNKVRSYLHIRRLHIILSFFIASLGLSVLFSSLPIISTKYFANTLWYISACYFFVRRNLHSQEDVERLIKLFFLLSIGVVIYSLIQQAQTNFSSEFSNVSVRPFFTEHGSYAAYLSIVLGISIGISFYKGEKRGLRKFAQVTSILLIIAIIFSYTRAAWFSIIILFLFVIIMRARDVFRLKSFIYITTIAVSISIGIVYLGVQASLQRNVKSITDVEQNLSNLERLNRWVAAVNMIRAHPIVGVGYGAYPFEFEKYKDRRFDTPISGFLGFPHNDYLQYFSEAGVFGILSWLLFLFFFYKVGISHYFRMRDELMRNILLGCLGGVLTYLVHAFFNGFLLFDKVAVPFWVTLALSVIIIELSYEKNLLNAKRMTFKTM